MAQEHAKDKHSQPNTFGWASSVHRYKVLFVCVGPCNCTFFVISRLLSLIG